MVVEEMLFSSLGMSLGAGAPVLFSPSLSSSEKGLYDTIQSIYTKLSFLYYLTFTTFTTPHPILYIHPHVNKLTHDTYTTTSTHNLPPQTTLKTGLSDTIYTKFSYLINIPLLYYSTSN